MKRMGIVLLNWGSKLAFLVIKIDSKYTFVNAGEAQESRWRWLLTLPVHWVELILMRAADHFHKEFVVTRTGRFQSVVYSVRVSSPAVVGCSVQAMRTAQLRAEALTFRRNSWAISVTWVDSSRFEGDHFESSASFLIGLLLLPVSLSVWTALQKAESCKFIFSGHTSSAAAVTHKSPSVRGFPGLVNKWAAQKFNLVASFSYLSFLKKVCAVLRMSQWLCVVWQCWPTEVSLHSKRSFVSQFDDAVVHTVP